MNRKKLLKAVESTAGTAAEKGQAAFDEAVHRIAPYVEQATEYAAPLARDASRRSRELAAEAYEHVQPALAEAQRRGFELALEAQHRGLDIAAEAYERVHPRLHEAKRRGARLAADTFDRIHPALDEALDRVTPAVEGTMGRVQPVVDDAMARIPPAVDVARDRLQRDLLPRFAAALHEAAQLPLALEAGRQLSEATALLVAEEEPPAKRKRGIGRTLAKIALAGAVLAGVMVAVKKLLGPSDTGWEAHQPSQPYVADPVADVVDDLNDKAAAAAEAAAEATEVTEDAAQDVAEQVEGAAEAAEEAAQDVVEAVAEATEGDAEGDAEDDASPLADSPYGEGSYVGANPPEGFVIKGNERSRKYHVQGTGGYERTITDIWFASSEAAERAGFVKAQR